MVAANMSLPRKEFLNQLSELRQLGKLTIFIGDSGSMKKFDMWLSWRRSTLPPPLVIAAPDEEFSNS
jgi:hypothetical protein